MKKTLTTLEWEKYRYNDTVSKVLRISDTLSAFSAVGSSIDYDNTLSIQLTEVKNIGKNIKKLSDYCFASCFNLTTLVIPENVKIFGDYCCTNLSTNNELAIFREFNPQSVYSIGEKAFAHTNITKMSLDLRGEENEISNLPYEHHVDTAIDTGPYIGPSAFMDCKKLTTVNLCTSTELGSHMFDGCTSLTTVRFANHGQGVGSHAFANCTSLKTIQFPSNFEMISPYMFKGCTQLEKVEILSSPIDEERFTCISEHAFSGCHQLTSIILPNGLANVEDYAFNGCSSLTSITFPASITNPNMLNISSLINTNIQEIYFNGIASSILSTYAGYYNRIDTPAVFNPVDQMSDFKYGTWYGKSGKEPAKALIDFATTKQIPLVYIDCSAGCGLCKTLVDRVLSTEECSKWVHDQPYLFAYTYYSMGSAAHAWGWDCIHAQYGKGMQSIGIPLFILYWAGHTLYVQERGVRNLAQFKSLILNKGNFGSYIRNAAYENYALVTVQAQNAFHGASLQYHIDSNGNMVEKDRTNYKCYVYSSDNQRYIWEYYIPKEGETSVQEGWQLRALKPDE